MRASWRKKVAMASGSWRQTVSPRCQSLVPVGVGDADACVERNQQTGWEVRGATSC